MKTADPQVMKASIFGRSSVEIEFEGVDKVVDEPTRHRTWDSTSSQRGLLEAFAGSVESCRWHRRVQDPALNWRTRATFRLPWAPRLVELINIWRVHHRQFERCVDPLWLASADTEWPRSCLCRPHLRRLHPPGPSCSVLLLKAAGIEEGLSMTSEQQGEGQGREADSSSPPTRRCGHECCFRLRPAGQIVGTAFRYDGNRRRRKQIEFQIERTPGENKSRLARGICCPYTGEDYSRDFLPRPNHGIRWRKGSRRLEQTGCWANGF